MALERLMDLTGGPPTPDALYTAIVFPEPSEARPYLFINMAATTDGKIVLGKIGGTAAGVGGPTDQILFRRLQRNCDAALIGSSTLRASQVIYPPDILRFVVTRSGDIPVHNRFFTDAPDRAFVLVPEDLPTPTVAKLTASTNVIQIGKSGVDLKAALRLLRQEMQVRTLLCEGGGGLNEELLKAGLADELFLTLAPKLKGGAHLPTIVEGDGFPPTQALPLTLLSVYRDEDELYLRYRIGREPRLFTRAKPD
jgi:2,5-diamino-6-(ribosylamino)-4(3H)-pyrimidinone 5'-phosphate reductase